MTTRLKKISSSNLFSIVNRVAEAFARRGFVRVLAAMLPLALTLLFAQCNSRSSDADSDDKAKAKVVGTPIQGGTFEASGVVAVPGTDGVLFVDDNRPGEVLWMQVDGSGRQAGPVKPIQLGASVDNPEGITFDGTYFYIVSSQSSRKANEQGGLARFSYDPRTQTVTDVQVIAGLREFLAQNVPEIGDKGDKKGDTGGLNIEGIAWDPERERLLLGLRSPIVNGQALIVAVRLRDRSGPFALENLQMAEPYAAKLSIGGAGIRDIQYDSRLKSFLIISGAPENQEKTSFALFVWNGKSGSGSTPSMKMDLGQKMKAEGVTRVEIGSTAAAQEYLLVVGDSSSYLKVDYSEVR